jgi:hypothetical protein
MVVTNQEHGIDRRWRLQAAWLIGLAAIAFALAWLSPWVQRYFAPWLIFSVLLGMALGVAAGALARRINLPPMRWMFAALALAALAIGVGQHLFAWLEYRQRFEHARQSKPEAALMELAGQEVRAKPLAEFLTVQAKTGRRIGAWQLSPRWTWLSWGLDAVAIVLSATGGFYAVTRVTKGAPA